MDRRAAGGTEDGAEVDLTISGMTCAACAARIEHRLNRLPGVRASVNFATARARATVPAGGSARELIAAIEAIGYRASLAVGAQADPADEGHWRMLRVRLLVAAAAFLPLCDLSLIFWLIPVARFPGWQWLLAALAAPVVSFSAWPFYVSAVRGLGHGVFTMDTLVSLGILAATGCSLEAVFFQPAPHPAHSLLLLFSHHVTGVSYLDVAAGVTTFLLAGRCFEAWMRRRTTSALGALAALGAKEVSVLDEKGEESRRPVEDLVVGARFVVRPGEAIATDGEVEAGHCSLDRSMMTGESLPIELSPGDAVVGGTVVLEGSVVVRATGVGADTQLARLVRLVEDAQNEKAGAQRLADRIAGVFVPCVVLAAAATLAGWLLAGSGVTPAVDCALAVLIIACPCALGLATPTALVVASGTGAQRGIFFKGYLGLEASQRVDTVVFDKTGTVTAGRMTLLEVESAPGVTREELLRLAGALEQSSEHPVGRAVTHAAREELGVLPAVEQFVAVTGLGVRGTVAGAPVAVGRRGLLSETDLDPRSALARRRVELERLGRTTVVVTREGVAVGLLGLGDSPRPSAAAAVGALRRMGLRCVLLSGDNETATREVARAVGIDEVRAEVLPEEKVELVRDLQRAGRRVAMVGDGVNDGPALAAADLAIAVGSGTDVAIGAADLIVVGEDLEAVPTAVALASRTIRTIRGNLCWAFAYNVAALPLAACGLLNPLVAGAAMACSSAFVVWNSARLRTGAGPQASFSRRRQPSLEIRPKATTTAVERSLA